MDQQDAVEEDHNDEEDTKSSSVTSQDEALMELLGLDSCELPFEDLCQSSEEEESSTPPCHHHQQHIPLKLPPNNHRHGHPPEDCWAYRFPDMVSPEECHALIQLATKNGSFQYVTKALLHTTPNVGDNHNNNKTKLEVQLDHPNHHKLSVFHHPGWVETLWKRIQHRLRLLDDNDVQQHNHKNLLSSFLNRERRRNPSFPPPTALNPRLRILKYDADDQDDFAPHYDATTRSSSSSCSISLLTVLLYLNTGGGHDFEGGETYFINAVRPDKNPTPIIPKAGTMVIFEHDLYHSGHPLVGGTKYVLRTDLFFDISEEEWASRAQQRRAGESRNPKTTKGQHPPTPITMVDLVALEWKNDAPSNDHHRVMILDALEELGMKDASIESFCAPGKFALLLMLQDVLPCLQTSQRLVERAFDHLLSQKK